MPANDSTRGVSPVKRHEEYYFRDGNICFMVENTAFRLHRFFFERESEYFHDRLRPSSEGEDGSPDSPYIIRDVTCEEFADFIWVWYNPRYTFSNQGKPKWLTILKLATLWGFGEIRGLAIRHLEKIKLEPIEKITTYKQYSVDDDLLLPSYMSLCTSPTLPSPEDGDRLTLKTVLRLASAREQILLRASEQGCRTPTIASAPEDLIKAIVAEIFGLIVHSNDQSVRVDAQAANTANTDVISVNKPAPKKGKPNSDTSKESPQPFPFPATGMNGIGSANKKK